MSFEKNGEAVVKVMHWRHRERRHNSVWVVLLALFITLLVTENGRADESVGPFIAPTGSLLIEIAVSPDSLASVRGAGAETLESLQTSEARVAVILWDEDRRRPPPPSTFTHGSFGGDPNASVLGISKN